jgi:hypothetical protein
VCVCVSVCVREKQGNNQEAISSKQLYESSAHSTG